MINLAIVGLGNIYERTKSIIAQNPDINVVEVCDKNEVLLNNHILDENVFKTTDYKLLSKSDTIMINTPPKTHFEIAKYFIENNKNIILEKPLVTTIEELEQLNELRLKHNIKIYSMLHYSFGKEIIWWKNQSNTKELPTEIVANFHEPYYVDGKLNSHSISLGGAYIDSTINSLSGIFSLFYGEIKLKHKNLKYDTATKIDILAKSEFEIIIDNKSIQAQITIDWNKDIKERSIYLFYKNYTIHLDGKNQQVIKINFDNNTNEILYKADGISIENHYSAMLDDFVKKADNFDFSYKLHKAILTNI